jgi:hypothetical protein
MPWQSQAFLVSARFPEASFKLKSFVLRELGAQHLIYILEHTPDPHQPIPIMR